MEYFFVYGYANAPKYYVIRACFLPDGKTAGRFPNEILIIQFSWHFSTSGNN